jgi:acyl dehydratase
MTDLPTEVTTIDELKGLIGKEIGVGKWVEVTQDRVNAFADVTGDHQYIHVDPERARKTMFGGTVAHGYLTLSMLPLLSQDREGVRINLGGRMAVNYGVNRVRFPHPVPVGKRIRSHSTLLSVEEVKPGAGPDGKPEAVQMVYQQSVEIEGIEKPGMVAETVSRIYF